MVFGHSRCYDTMVNRRMVSWFIVTVVKDTRWLTPDVVHNIRSVTSRFGIILVRPMELSLTTLGGKQRFVLTHNHCIVPAANGSDEIM